MTIFLSSGLEYGATYKIMVYTVNNELLDTSTQPLPVEIVVENHGKHNRTFIIRIS